MMVIYYWKKKRVYISLFEREFDS